MNRYRFDIREILFLVPSLLQKDKLQMLLHKLLIPLSRMHSSFCKYMNSKRSGFEYSGRVYDLQRYVKEFCDNDGCYISDGGYKEEVFVPYNGTENLANYNVGIPYDNNVDPQVNILYAGYGQIAQTDFVIHLPKELRGNIDERKLRSEIDKYKIAGKFYTIVYESNKNIES